MAANYSILLSRTLALGYYAHAQSRSKSATNADCVCSPHTDMISVVNFAVLLLVASLVRGQLDCAYPTRTDLASVIQNTLRSGDAASNHDINVTAFHPLCLAYSAQKHRYRGISVLINYTCRGPATCPRGESAIEQFESECEDGRWSNRILGTFSAGSRTIEPTASFSTTLREDCAFCFSPELCRNPATGASHWEDGMRLTTD